MKLSRHARNNMRLYGISDDEVAEAIQSPDWQDKKGERMIAGKHFHHRFSGLPLKVVYRQNKEVFVITAYPLKKAYRR